MQVLLVTALHWLLRHLLSLVLIVAVLLLGRAAWDGWQAWQSIRAESAQLKDAEPTINASLQKLALEVNSRAAGLEVASLAKIEERITAVDSEIALIRLERQRFAGLAPILAGQTIGQAQLRVLQIDGAIGLLQKEREWLQDAKQRLLAAQSAQVQRAELERLRQRHISAYLKWQAVGRDIDALEKERWVKSRIPGTTEYQQLQALIEHRSQLLVENQRADTDYKQQLAQVNGARNLPPLAALPLPTNAVKAALQPFTRAWMNCEFWSAATGSESLGDR